MQFLVTSPHVARQARKLYPDATIHETDRVMPRHYAKVLQDLQGDVVFLGPETFVPRPEHLKLAQRQLDAGYSLIAPLFDNWRDPLTFFLGLLVFRFSDELLALWQKWDHLCQQVNAWAGFRQALYENPVPFWPAPPTWWRRDGQDQDVAVVIPCYEHEEFLSDAIVSTLQQKNLAYVVVVDDGSSDVRGVLKRFVGKPVYVVEHKENFGLPTARNSGIRACQTTLVASLDADDMWQPDALTHMVRAYRPTCWVVPDVQLFGDANRRVKVNISLQSMQTLQPAHPAVLFSRDSWVMAGGFDQSIKAFESWDFHCRLIEAQIPPLKVNKVCVRYRKRRKQGMLANIMRHKKEHLSALKERNPGFFER